MIISLDIKYVKHHVFWKEIVLGLEEACFDQGKGECSTPADSALSERQIVAEYQHLLERDAIKLLKQVCVVNILKDETELGLDIFCKSGSMLVADGLGLPACSTLSQGLRELDGG